MKIAWDAAYPNGQNPPGTTVVLIYAGGNATHIWTEAEIAAASARFRLPVWVGSNRSNTVAAGDSDGTYMLEWLWNHHVPKGVCVVLDLETLVAPAYVAAFGASLRVAGYRTLPYGSRSTLFLNPHLGGYFDARPGFAGISAGCVATQYGYFDTFDLSRVDDSVPLWDTHAAPHKPPAPQYLESNMICGDPVTGGIWAVSPVDGHVEASAGAPYLGGLNNHPDWDALKIGPVAGIAPYKDSTGQTGYKIAVLRKEALNNEFFSYYTFPRDRSQAG